MSSTAENSRQQRALAQRNRILDAAQQCFSENGFHGASMANIAETAQMSPGLIYRYFKGKSELIHGIVSRQIELIAEDLETFKSSASEAARHIAERFKEVVSSPKRRTTPSRLLEPALILEIVAESGRDPVIASALDELDTYVDKALSGWLALPQGDGDRGVPPDQLAARTLILRSLLDGLKMRQARYPELDEQLLHQALDIALHDLRRRD
ncbi:MAG: TetR/AcrR family transcriptional regulator [Xanthomonadales bacterium]|nr:TetR/AcrR family transcriptional regulator [Xanthomonadales bacterium]MCB1632942.1 TetR/AcrR family transcriptional regulator [Xanthomonadales bacterium]